MLFNARNETDVIAYMRKADSYADVLTQLERYQEHEAKMGYHVLHTKEIEKRAGELKRELMHDSKYKFR